jgi:hypothetical protein
MQLPQTQKRFYKRLLGYIFGQVPVADAPKGNRMRHVLETLDDLGKRFLVAALCGTNKCVKFHTKPFNCRTIGLVSA